MQNKSAADGIQLHAPAQQGTRIDGSASWEARCGLMARRLRRFQARMRPLPARQHQQAVRICQLTAPPQELATFEGVARCRRFTALPERREGLLHPPALWDW